MPTDLIAVAVIVCAWFGAVIYGLATKRPSRPPYRASFTENEKIRRFW